MRGVEKRSAMESSDQDEGEVKRMREEIKEEWWDVQRIHMR